MIALPIDPLLPQIVAHLREAQSLVLEAPPGAGKTTRVPRALFDAGFAADGDIVVLEPRRLAARMAASRVAEEMGEPVGQTVGYQVRFEDVSSGKTRVRFVTEGILSRRLVADPRLSRVACVVLDEFHERHLQGDIALAFLHRLQKTRPDLKLVVMSATLSAEPIAAFLGASRLRSEGRVFPVSIEHARAADERPLHLQVASAVRSAVNETPEGDVLVFLPGAREIRQALEVCAPIVEPQGILALPLHGELPPRDQDLAVKPSAQRKVILSTNVAESSVTIDGVVTVIDSGLARIAGFSPWSGLSTLTVDKISQASAIQRAGRAGRTRPGRCLRLYTQGDFDKRRAFDAPEIARLDLTQTALEVAALGGGDLSWLDAPPGDRWNAALLLLGRLGALAEGRLTDLGRRLLTFPLHPRQARVLVACEEQGYPDEGALIASLLAERDIRANRKARFDDRARGGHAATEPSDVVALVDLFEEAEAASFSHHVLRAAELDGSAVRAVARAHMQLARNVARNKTARVERDEAIARALLLGYPDRVAKRKRAGGAEFAMAGGGLAELSEQSVVRDAIWIVAVDAEERRTERGARPPLIRLASSIEPDWLIDHAADRIEERAIVRWNAQAERAEGVQVMAYEGLALSESPCDTGDALSEELYRAATARGPAAFAPEGALDAWLARIRFAASCDPNVKAPSDDEVLACLRKLCEGKRSFRELREAALLDWLKSETPGIATLDRLAPERLSLPNGRTVAIQYEPGKAPWVESFLQDFFGLSAAPRIGGGRVDLVMHLLAPNRRAVQVTTDLPGFFERHYPSIRKELMRKYPRHPWPEDTSTPVIRQRRS